MPNSQSKIHTRLWVLMLSAFAMVGACATIAVAGYSLSSYEEDSRKQALALAKVIALQLSPEQQIQFTRKDADSYHQANATIARAQRQDAAIRRIYTIRKNGAFFETVLDSTVDSREPLPPSILSPTPGIDRDARSVFESGLAFVDEELVEERGGYYFSAYAPLIGRNGRVEAVLAVDRDATDIVNHAASLRQASLVALAIVVLLGALFSQIIVRQLARNSKSEAWLRGATTSKKIFRATILELGLAALATAVLAIGVYSQIRIGELRADESRSVSLTGSLDQYRSRIDRLLRDNLHDRKGLAILSESAEHDGLTWLAGSLNACAKMEEGDWRAPLWQGLAAIRSRLDEERSLRERYRAEMGEMSERMSSALVLAILLSFGSLVLVRGAAKKEQELAIAKHDSQRHQVAYQQVAENLPIGFYTYRDGDIEDSNGTWDHMVTRLPGEDRMMALERAVHNQDLPSLVDAFTCAQTDGSPFQIQFRLKASMNEMRHFETRGQWVSKPDEGIDHLLGFILDVTDLVRVNEQLEERSSELTGKNLMLSRALSDLEENLEAMVQGLVKAVEAKDSYTAGHSERVMNYSVAIGEALGLGARDLRILQRGTLIHDVGKIGIPDAVLNKPAKLTDEEFEIIKMHPTIGAQMVRGIPVFEECIPIILWHHERLDGTGYPDGIPGCEIPTMVRIASVADVFDALTSTRAYRSALAVDQALEILRKDAKSGILDGKIVEVLADIVKRNGVLWRERGRDAA